MLIRKPRTRPLEILAYEALIRRLPDNHPRKPDLLSAFRSRLSGHNGERNTEHYINSADVIPFHVYHNLRFEHSPNEYVQIDTLLLARQLAIILEIKYLGGKSLFFKGDANQVIQTSDEGEQKTYDCPVMQARRQKHKLLKWCRNLNFPSIRVEHFALMANSRPELIFSEDYCERWRVFRSTALEFRLQELTIFNKPPDDPMPEETFRQLDQALLDAHEEFIPNLLKRHKIHFDNVIKGVFCPECPAVLMTRTSRGWGCPVCLSRCSTRSAVNRTLREYCLFAGRIITNATISRFLGLDSPSLTSNILRRTVLPKSGDKRGSVYSLKGLLTEGKEAKDN
ncbi:nuclease-related domain-containing protein [Alteribacter natronophilus]|uniref:nuclease-related domain-containing protein n=1 Tax=Alteribacter natronophilus TaxID=2583810 RepID=UPI00110F5774|nr:nuclease-related domain-containing protein [Alteribacter natronophilus]TMW70397.1 NERD domain-containing protein [Alteribacter natronophilus]